MNNTRYPGIYFFTKEQKDLFFGRDKDIKKMLTLVQVEKHILLYSKSGIGKTSLIRAGLVPNLPQNFKNVIIRFFTDSSSKISPLRRLTSYIKIYFKDERSEKNYLLDKLRKEDKKNELWYIFKKLQLFFQDQPDTTFLIIFDQFEELFTYTEKEIQEFIVAIKNLINNNLPEFAFEKISKLLDTDSNVKPDDLAKLQQPVNIKLVFSIRDDKLSYLNKISKYLPEIQNIFHELNPLTPAQVKEAIINPGKVEGNFKSNKFEYSETAVEKITNYLSKKGEADIETTQLQIICQNIEDKIIKNKTLTSNVVSDKDVPDFKNVFKEYYEASINELTEEEREVAKRMIEAEFIVSGKRTSVDENKCLNYIDEDNLKTLVDKFLLRAVPNNVGGYNYELAHDTLILPISEIAEHRKIEREKAIEEKALQEELRKAKEDEAKQKAENARQRKRNTIVSIALVIALIAVGFAFTMMKKMQNEKSKKIETQYKYSVEKSENLVNNYGDYEQAILELEQIKSFDIKDEQKNRTIDSLISIYSQKKENYSTEFEKYVGEGDTAFKRMKYYEAYVSYLKADSLDYFDKGVEAKIQLVKASGTMYYIDRTQIIVDAHSFNSIPKDKLKEVDTFLNYAYILSPDETKIQNYYKIIFKTNID